MGESFTLGRIAGIRIGLNWSWLIVVALISWTLATGIFPETNPGLGGVAYWAMAVVAAILFFVSLLLHELGHALRARREGMEIEGIVLWLFGGVATFKGAFPSAGAELRIAVAGPLVSLALGVLFVAAAAGLGLPNGVDGVAAWLGWTNLMLLAFNLLPALPLDGGRVLRSLLWLRRGDFASATRTAATVARGLAYAMIAGGVALFVLEGQFSGAWLAFLGWFLLQASTAEARYVLAEQALGGLHVRDLMTPDPVTAGPELTLGRFMDEVVSPRRHTTYPVVSDGRAVGLLPFRCVAEVPRAEWDTRRVRECMLPLADVPVVGRDDRVGSAMQGLLRSPLRRALVVDDGRLVGLLSVSDLADGLARGAALRTRA